MDGVTETFTIGVDIDEFWLLPPEYKTLQAMIAANPDVDLYIGDWFLIVNDRRGHDLTPPYRGNIGWNSKCMVRTSRLVQTPETVSTTGAHKPVLTRGKVVEKRGSGAGKVVQFCTRSFVDPVLRSTFYDKNNKGVIDLANLKELAVSQDDLPDRLLMAAYLAGLPNKDVLKTSYTLQKVDYALERQIMTEKGVGVDVVSSLYQVYMRYKNCIMKDLQYGYMWGPKATGLTVKNPFLAIKRTTWSKRCVKNLHRVAAASLANASSAPASSSLS